MIAVWAAGDRRFDCTACENKPKLKRLLGCDGPPMDGDRPTRYGFPPGAPEVYCERCPMREITEDIYQLVQGVNLSQQAVSIADQQCLPPVYVDAAMMVIREQNRRMRAETEAKRNG